MKHLLALLFCLAAAAPGHAQVDRASVILLGASVLKIEVQRAQGGYSLGSGVVVRPDKVVTNCHVTRDAAQIHVLRGGLRWQVQAQAVDAERDLCVLHAPALEASAVGLARSAELRIGQPVTALGFTGGLGIQNSPGQVVALHRHDAGVVIQSSNWFTSGASGGGLFDDELRLVGVLTYRLRGGEAHYFAAPTEWLQPLLDDAAAFLPVRPIAPARLAYWQKPVEQQPRFLRAALMERDHQWTELEALAAQWVVADAQDAEPWYVHGIALARLDRLPDARRALERAVGLEAAFGEAWLQLGQVYLRQGFRDLADGARQRLVALNSNLAATLGQALQNP